MRQLIYFCRENRTYRLEVNNTADIFDEEFVDFTFTNLIPGAQYKATSYTTIQNVPGEESQADILLGKFPKSDRQVQVVKDTYYSCTFAHLSKILLVIEFWIIPLSIHLNRKCGTKLLDL